MNRRRVRSPHPGVVLRSRTWPSGEVTWYARFHDPNELDQEKDTDVNLTKLGKTSHEARVAWCKAKSRELQARQLEIESGAERHGKTPIGTAIADFIAFVQARRHGETPGHYRRDASLFLAWCESNRVKLAEQLAPRHLSMYRAWLEARPRLRPAKGGKRGEHVHEQGAKIAPGTLNTRLRHLGALVSWLRKRGCVPRLLRDACAEALKHEPVLRDPPRPFTPAELQRLLRAALRHDETGNGPIDMHGNRVTREEAAALGPGALKPVRPRPIVAPMLLFVLLSGARIGEAATIQWEDVDLTAADRSGVAVGSVRIWADRTKTRRGRVLSLGHSPVLHHLLLALRVAWLRDAEKVLRLDQLDKVREPRGPIFPGWTPGVRINARTRLINDFNAPAFTWSTKSGSKDGTLRSTTECYLVNAPGIFNAASAWAAAALLGHDVETAQRHYLGVLPGLDPSARTLEAAMKIEDLAREVVARVSGEARDAAARRGAVS